MKIIGFAQLHNEMKNDNLENWFKCMFSVCDYVYVYDQASTDGSLEFYETFENLVVIKSDINDFSNEIKCKQTLLQMLLKDHSDVDYIFWMDGDTLLDNRLMENNGEALHKLCQDMHDNNLDYLNFGHYNLWRSDTYYRIDDNYHWLNKKVPALWRNTGNLEFPDVSGLHLPQLPSGLINSAVCPYALIHRGFTTDDQIIRRYDRYKERGQEGHLDRMLNENGLTVERIPDNLLPSWFKLTDDINPLSKTKIREIYEQQR